MNMKKVLVLALVLFLFSPVAFAAKNLGTISQSVAVGKTVTVHLNPSTTGRWFAPSLSNTNRSVAIISTNGNNLIIQGLSAGSASAMVCSEIQNENCLTVNVNVSNVLGESVVAMHPEGSWVKSGSTVYYVTNAGLIPVTTWKIFLSNGGKSSRIVQANESDLSLPMLSFMTLKDSRVK